MREYKIFNNSKMFFSNQVAGAIATYEVVLLQFNVATAQSSLASNNSANSISASLTLSTLH